MEAVEFTREQLDAIKIVDSFYSLKKDTDLAKDRLRDFKNNGNHLCHLKSKNDYVFDNTIPKLFCDILDAIERGELKWDVEKVINAKV